MAQSVFTGPVIRRFSPAEPGGFVSAEQTALLTRQGRIDTASILDDMETTGARYGSRRHTYPDGTTTHTHVSQGANGQPMVYTQAVVSSTFSPGDAAGMDPDQQEPEHWVPPLFLAFDTWAIDYIGKDPNDPDKLPWVKYAKPPEIHASEVWHSVCVAPLQGDHEPDEDWIDRISPRGVTMCLKLGDEIILGGYGAQPIDKIDQYDENLMYVVDIDGDRHEYAIRAEGEGNQHGQRNTQEWELTYGSVGDRLGLNGLTYGISLDGKEGSGNHVITRVADETRTLSDKLYWNRKSTPAALWVHSKKTDDHQQGGLWCTLNFWFDMDLALLIDESDGTRRKLHHTEYKHHFTATSANIPPSLTFINNAHGTTTYTNAPEISIWNTEAAFYGELFGLALSEIHSLWEWAIKPFIPYCWFDTTVPIFMQRRRWKRVVIFEDVEIPVDLPDGLFDEVTGYVLSSVVADRACIVAIEITHVDPDSDGLKEHIDAVADRLVRSPDRPDTLVENQDDYRAILEKADKTREVTYWAVADGEASDITELFEEIMEDVETDYDTILETLEDRRPIAALRATATKFQAIELPHRETF